MSEPRHIAVFDVGKTNAKVVLVDLKQAYEVEVLTTANTVLSDGPYPHFDDRGLWDFLCAGLTHLQRRHGIDAITVTTHGASAALLTADGRLAAPILDYEHAGPDELSAEYDRLRPPFSETGSPRLPMGLNLGAQLHWLARRHPGLIAETAQIVTLPGYWCARLAGPVVSDVCSLGCHTDLWNPTRSTYSGLPAALGLHSRMALPAHPGTLLGAIRPELAQKLGLDLSTPVHLGIHDSNASLVSHLGADTPRAVVSSGTWVVAMALQGVPVTLDPARDTLINVSAQGQAVPSARFMGGRDFDILAAKGQATPSALGELLQSGVMLLPSVTPASGPFQGRAMRWTGQEPQGDLRFVAVSAYLALMTATCLDLIGAQGPTIVEGPFAQNPAYAAILAAATGREVRAREGQTGTAIGAAMMIGRASAGPDGHLYQPDPALANYANAWRAAVG